MKRNNGTMTSGKVIMKELCIRCGKPTIYTPSIPITLRRYYIEGSGQLCEHCYLTLYPVPASLQSNLGDEERSRTQEKQYSE